MRNRQIFVLALLVLCAAFLQGWVEGGTLSSHQVKIAKVDRARTTAVLQWPASRGHPSFVMGTPFLVRNVRNEGDPAVFRGSLRVLKAGTLLYSTSFSSTDVKRCNWLSHSTNGANLHGFILPWEQTNLVGSLVANESYDMEIIFETLPPEGSSLWVCWVEDGSVQPGN